MKLLENALWSLRTKEAKKKGNSHVTTINQRKSFLLVLKTAWRLSTTFRMSITCVRVYYCHGRHRRRRTVLSSHSGDMWSVKNFVKKTRSAIIFFRSFFRRECFFCRTRLAGHHRINCLNNFYVLYIVYVLSGINYVLDEFIKHLKCVEKKKVWVSNNGARVRENVEAYFRELLKALRILKRNSIIR